jgi:Xaa-Pro aminopeptidase
VKNIDIQIKNPVLNITPYLDEFFSIKDELLLTKISKSAMLSDMVFKRLYLLIKAQKIYSEHGAYEFINYTLKRLFLEAAFSPIVANSINSANIHHAFPSKRAFRKGFLLIDLGVKYDGVCSDLSRMIYLGKPSLKEKELYDLVKCVQEKSISYVKEGILYKNIENYARRLLGKYSSYFTHLLGHGLGYYPHECPSFSEISEDKVIKNHVFTIEPGIYFKGKFGIRIEDSCYFDGKAAISLTKSKKELLLV